MGDGSLTVSDYSKRFLDKYLQSIDDSEEAKGKSEVAGSAFTNLLKKLFEAGSTKDVQIPLRVLRDEIGRIYFGSAQQWELKIEHLFMLYDSLEEAAQQEARSKPAKEAAWALTVLEELRQRFSRLVIGDTWQAWPQLQLKALKRMHAFAREEKASEKQIPALPQPATPTSGRLGKKLSRSFSTSSAQTVSSWQSAFDDLAKAPGTRLLPLIKLLLAEDNKGLADPPASTSPADLPGNSVKGGLHSAPSGISETGVVKKMSELDMMDMDDLLGLNDPPAKEDAPDPFQAPSKGGALPRFSGPPPPKQAPQQQQGANTSPRGENFNTANFDAGQTVFQHQNGQQNSFPARHSGSLSRGTSFDAKPPLASTTSGPLSTGPRLSSWGSGVINIPKGLNSIGTSPSPAGSFNPFDLPSPTYASPVPSHVDNSFAEFSPVAGAPIQPKVLNPMRAPPEPPKGSPLQPPKSSFSSW